jgi:hypothetical protein
MLRDLLLLPVTVTLEDTVLQGLREALTVEHPEADTVWEMEAVEQPEPVRVPEMEPLCVPLPLEVTVGLPDPGAEPE